MTLLFFIKSSCIAIVALYLVSVNMFKTNKRGSGVRPAPKPFSFYPKKENGLERGYLKDLFKQA